MTKHHLSRTVAPLIALALLAGCNSFEEDFALSAAIPVTEGSIEGAWVGAWHCTQTDHFGDLKAIVTRTSDNEYRVRYMASYKWLFLDATDEYEVALQGQWAGSTFHFSGSHDMGFLAGVYSYTGYATASEFFSTYEAGENRGDYELHRVPGAPQTSTTAP